MDSSLDTQQGCPTRQLRVRKDGAVPLRKGLALTADLVSAANLEEAPGNLHPTPAPACEGVSTLCFSNGNSRARSCLGLNNQPSQMILGISDGNPANEPLGFPGGKPHCALMEFSGKKPNQIN